MESQPQNPEFRNDPQNFHPCLNGLKAKLAIKWSLNMLNLLPVVYIPAAKVDFENTFFLTKITSYHYRNTEFWIFVRIMDFSRNFTSLVLPAEPGSL